MRYNSTSNNVRYRNENGLFRYTIRVNDCAIIARRGASAY